MNYMYLYKLHVYNSGETITATVLPTSNLTVRLQSISGDVAVIFNELGRN